MITKYKKHHRIIATLFLLIFFPTLVPNNMFASNNGPVAPEATSFEPVDATDMVNLATGDMSYVLPLLNIPSPEGGYPLALSYHAGIAMDQEASWVGLGWSLNPGAINRSVSGVPDDWKRSNTNLILYDAGGEAKDFFASVSVGWGGKGQYSVGLYGSYTENKTFGGSTTYRTDVGVQGGIGGINGSLGTDGASIGLGFGGKDSNYSGSIGANQSFSDGNSSFSLGFSGKGSNKDIAIGRSSIGISFSSKDGLSTSVGGQTQKLSGNKNQLNKTNLQGDGFMLPIQIYLVNVTLGFSKVRYWNYDNTATTNNGSLYPGDLETLNNESNFPDTAVFDSYYPSYKFDSDKESKNDNLSLVSYDYYSASGQGISGSFKPAIFEQGSLRNNSTFNSNTEYNVCFAGINNKFTKNIDNNINDIHFYFDNEIASYLRVSSGNWDIYNISSHPFNQMSPLNQQFNSSVTIDGKIQNGYNSNSKRKRTGSFIETFTNKEINSSNGTLIINPENYDRTNAIESGIGAFRITALDGKVYHYSLPVYQKEQFTKTTDLQSSFDNRFLENRQLDSYATHWLLTAITGPDYVDVNLNNKVDEKDYGYWTLFDYGKWSDGYVWQTPLKSNDKIKSYSWGVKEIYYLDKIKTRTHTALFIKEERQDDLSQSIDIGNSPSDLEQKDILNVKLGQGKDGFNYFYGPLGSTVRKQGVNDRADARFRQYIKTNKHKSLKLSKILLIKNENENIKKNNGQLPPSSFKGQMIFNETLQVYNENNLWNFDKPILSKTWFGEFFNNVFDTSDFLGSNIESKSIKAIVFNYSKTNELTKNSPNSESLSKGRLTLQSVDFCGKSGSKVIPPYKFEYNNDLSYDGSKEDNWGYYKDHSDEWSLNKITTPSGSKIDVQYESDDIDKEAVSGVRGFDSYLQFTFSNYNNKLRINVEKESGSGNEINFQDFFQVGATTPLDLWASIRHNYYDWAEKTRLGYIDVNTSVQVVAVSPTNVVLETDWSFCHDSNDGLGRLLNKAIGLNNHPDAIIENYKRGEWGNPPSYIGSPTDRLVLYYKLNGNMNSIPSSNKNGGGVRVKEISIYEGNVKKNATKYFYNVPGYGENKTDGNYKSSGITSFVPQKYFKEIKYKTELPSPGVMYEYVTVKNYSSYNELGLIEQYNFEVLKPDASTNENNLVLPNSLEIEKVQEYENPSFIENSATYKLNLSKFNIKDMTSNLGRLKQKKIFNSSLNLLSEDRYSFKNVLSIQQGISEESFNTYKLVRNGANLNYRLGVTSKIKYPSLLESTTTAQGGYSNTTYFDKYDFLTGQVTESHSVSSDGQSYKTKTIPAYLNPKYANMGSKVDDINNKNMLSQTAANYSYILDTATNTWKETGVGITTWSNIWSYKDIAGTTVAVPETATAKEKIWRKHKSFVWNGVKDAQGIFTNYNSATDDGFNWTVGVGSQPVQWKQASETTLYDHYSAPLEMKDINGNLASTKMGDNDTKVMATGNAGYNEMYFAGGENIDKTGIWIEPEVSIGNASQQNKTYFHTGKSSMSATSAVGLDVSMKNGQHRPGKYKVSVWVEKTNASNAIIRLNGAPINFITDNIVAGNWILKTGIITVPAGDCAVGLYSNSVATVYFDDLMIRPIASSITGYVYNEWDELTHIIGNNGLATRFDYDAAGRLVRTYSEVIDDPANGVVGGFKLRATNKINYKNL